MTRPSRTPVSLKQHCLEAVRKAELGLIGCCIAGGVDTCLDVIQSIKPEDLFNDDCVAAMQVITDLIDQNKTINDATFWVGWKARYNNRVVSPDVIDSPNKVPAYTMIGHYADQVKDFALRRKLATIGTDLIVKASDLATPSEASLVDAEVALGTEEIGKVSSLNGKDAAKRMIDDLERRQAAQGKPTGIVTGFADLDYITDGLQRQEQTIIAARPSIGKTALGLSIVKYVCLDNKVPTAFFSLEMSVEAIIRRLLSCYCQIPLSSVKKGQFTEREMAKVSQFNLLLRSSPIRFIDAVGGITATELTATMKRLAKKEKISLFVVDYLQKIKANSKHEKRTYEVGEVSGQLKSAAVQTNTALLTLAQLNRDSEKDKGRMPRLSDLADSAQIERDADVVGLLHRNRAENETQANLIIAKNRDGELGLVDLFFDGPHCQFKNSSKVRDVVF